jgi:hypothetical protein
MKINDDEETNDPIYPISKRMKKKQDPYERYMKVERYLMCLRLYRNCEYFYNACIRYLIPHLQSELPFTYFGEYAEKMINSPDFDLNDHVDFLWIKPETSMENERDRLFIKMVEGNTKEVSKKKWDSFYINACKCGAHGIVKYLLYKKIITNVDIEFKFTLYDFGTGPKLDRFSHMDEDDFKLT